MMLEGHSVYSPVVHGHPLARYGVPGDWSFWKRTDLWHLEQCREVLVLTIDGWSRSEGVQAEIARRTPR